MNHYTLKLCGFVKSLPIVKIGTKYCIAIFSILGDIDFVDTLAKELVERIKYIEFDYLVCHETKNLPLIYEMSKLLGSKNYVVARDKIWSYMSKAIKSEGKKKIVLNGQDAKLLKNKRVILVDDVVSTGRTMDELAKLIDKVGGKVVASVSVLKQGKLKIKFSKPFFYLTTLPLFSSQK